MTKPNSSKSMFTPAILHLLPQPKLQQIQRQDSPMFQLCLHYSNNHHFHIKDEIFLSTLFNIAQKEKVNQIIENKIHTNLTSTIKIQSRSNSCTISTLSTQHPPTLLSSTWKQTPLHPPQPLSWSALSSPLHHYTGRDRHQSSQVPPSTTSSTSYRCTALRTVPGRVRKAVTSTQSNHKKSRLYS